MKNNRPLQGVKMLCLGGALTVAASVAQAQVNGKLWENDTSNNADTVPSGTPNVTFTIPVINLQAGQNGVPYTIGGFLNSGGAATIITGAGELGNTDGDTHVQLTGSIFLNAGANSFSIGHDDGVRISLDGGIGTVVDVPGATAFALTPFTITAPTAGNYDFTVDYNECCNAPAVLEWAYPNGRGVGSPDGGTTALLLLLGVTGLAVMRRRK